MRRNSFIVLLLLSITLFATYALPKPRYEGTNLIPRLGIPTQFGAWTSRDMAQELDLTDDRYRFISHAFARLYKNAEGKTLLFLILDAGNFHHPKVCFTMSGFTVNELPDTDLTVAGRTLKAKTLSMQRGREGCVVLYWMCIDKHLTDWTGQKVNRFWASLLGKKSVGLMGRVDIQVPADSTPQQAVALAQTFLNTLPVSQNLGNTLFGE